MLQHLIILFQGVLPFCVGRLKLLNHIGLSKPKMNINSLYMNIIL